MTEYEELKQLLKDTETIVYQYVNSEITKEEFMPTVTIRHNARVRISELIRNMNNGG